MAEHPEEVADISKNSNCLLINLGNITDTRLKSFDIAAKSANDNKVPIIIDIVGVCCSKLRMDFALHFIEKFSPEIIKGNISEIKAIIGLEHNSNSVDASSKDKIDLLYSTSLIKKISSYSKEHKATLVATGETDIIISKDNLYTLHNGCESLAKITGTGCMSTALIACYLGFTSPELASMIGISMQNISAEYSDNEKGLGSFKISLHDHISTISSDEFTKKLKYNKYNITEL